MRATRLAPGALALTLLCAAPAGAQRAVPPGPTSADPEIRSAEEAYFEGEPHRAIDLLEGVLEPRPEAYEALWRGAWFSLTLGMLSWGREAQNRWFRRGAEYARRARGVRPGGVEARYWLAANLGLHAVQAGSARRMAELGEEVYRQSRRLLDERPDHAGAHNVLGRTHMEVMQLPAYSRVLGRIFVGGELLSRASWTRARRHLERAVELEPEVLYFRLDLARLERARGRSGAARTQACRLLSLPGHHPVDPKLKASARRLVAEIDGSRARPACG